MRKELYIESKHEKQIREHQMRNEERRNKHFFRIKNEEKMNSRQPSK